MMNDNLIPIKNFDWDDREVKLMYMDQAEREKVMKARGLKIIYRDSSEEENDVSSNDKEEAEVKGKDREKEKCAGGENEKEKKNTSDRNGETKRKWAIGDRCQALYYVDNQYYEATIIATLDANSYMIKFLGYDEEESVSCDHVRDSQVEATEGDQQDHTACIWAIGDSCQALYSADNQYYEATIVSVLDANFHMIRFLGYGNKELVRCDYIRESQGKSAQDDQEMHAATVWNPGDYCRAMYDSDGKWYEAKVIKFVDDDTCAVKFIGFDEVQNVHSLQPSRGEISRRLQEDIAVARRKSGSYSFSSPSDDDDSTYYSSASEHNRETVPKKRQSEKLSKSHRSISSSESGRHHRHSHSRPSDTVCIKNPTSSAAFPNYGNDDRRSFSTLLMSWYMAGYHAGIYQSRHPKSKRACCCCSCSH